MQSMEKSWWWVSWRNMPLLFLHSRLSPYTHLGSFNNWKCWSQIEPNFPVVKLKSLHAIPHPAFPPLPMPPRLLRKLYSGPILLSHALLHQIRAYTPLSPVPTVAFPPFSSWFFLSRCPQWLITVSRNHRGSQKSEISNWFLVYLLPVLERPSGAAPSPCRAALEEDVTEVRDPDQERN